MPSSEDAQRNGPYRRNGVTRSNRARPPPKHDVAYLRAGNNPSATPKLSHKIHRRRSRALIVRRLPESSAKSQDFPNRRRPPYENLPCQLLYLKNGLAEAHFPDRSTGSHVVRDIEQGKGMFHAAVQLKISLGFFAAPYLLFAARHMIIFMILMQHRRHQRCIHHRSEEHTSELQSLRHLVCR